LGDVLVNLIALKDLCDKRTAIGLGTPKSLFDR